MKQFLQGLGITLLMAISILGLGTKLNAQTSRYDSNLTTINIKDIPKDDIKLNVKVLLQDKNVETNSVEFTIYYSKSKKSFTSTINNDFVLYLQPDREYILSFTHKGYNKRSVIVNTAAPNNNSYVIDLSMRLYNDQPGGVVGSIYYDKALDNFQANGNVQNTTK